MSSNTQSQAVQAAAPCSGFRHCQCLMPDPATHAWLGQPTEILLSHYSTACTGCYSCGWVRYAVHQHVPDPARDGMMVANTRRQKISPEHVQGLGKGHREQKPLLMYVYPKKVDDRSRWIAVPCRPFLPYLLREQDTTGVERFVRLATGRWVGLFRGQHAPFAIDPDTRPPMRNALYEKFGYARGKSPYLPHGHRAYRDGRVNGLWRPGFGVHPPRVANGPQANTLHTPVGGSSSSAVTTPAAITTTTTTTTLAPAATTTTGNGNGTGTGTPNPTSSSSNGDGVDVADDKNTTVFVGCLAASVTREDLEAAFNCFGEIADLRVFRPKPGSPIKNGFVYFFDRRDAEMALEQLQGLPIHGNRVRLSWGRAEDRTTLRSRTERHIRPPTGQTQ